MLAHATARLVEEVQMIAQRSSSYVFALLLATAGAACGSDNNNNNNTADGGGGGDGDGDGDAGLGAQDSSLSFSGTVGPVEGTAEDNQCHDTSKPAAKNNCAGFYCGTNSNSLKAAKTSKAACGSDGEILAICAGTITKKVEDCARKSALRTDPRTATETCVRDDKTFRVISDKCLTCYLDSADCAREKCISECLAGASNACDTCRETNKCTPTFYKCAGLPDPQ
jgi:hypothetical protein